MFVMEDPRLTQAGPACMIFCNSKPKCTLLSSSKTNLCVPDLNSRKSGSSQLEHVTSKLRGKKAHAELSFPQTARALQHQNRYRNVSCLYCASHASTARTLRNGLFNQLYFDGTSPMRPCSAACSSSCSHVSKFSSNCGRLLPTLVDSARAQANASFLCCSKFIAHSPETKKSWYGKAFRPLASRSRLRHCTLCKPSFENRSLRTAFPTHIDFAGRLPNNFN